MVNTSITKTSSLFENREVPGRARGRAYGKGSIWLLNGYLHKDEKQKVPCTLGVPIYRVWTAKKAPIDDVRSLITPHVPSTGSSG